MPRRTFGIWIAVALACVACMWLFPGEETVSYHIGYAAFALSFGLAPWSVGETTVALVGYTFASGLVLVMRAAADVVAWEETAEIPLMLTLVLLMVWLVRRRQKALDELTRLAAIERLEIRSRELLTQRTSHEMRSPLTISRGYVELLRSRTREPHEDEELAIVSEELERLTRVCERLVRAFSVQGESDRSSLDVDELLHETARRWSTVADREWVVEATAGTIEASAERLRACLDTLIENAVRYTAPGDTVRLLASADPVSQLLRIGVADSGPGLSDEQVRRINASPSLLRDPTLARHVRDELSQTGLGLGLVLEIVERRGGRLEAGRAREGGACLTMVVPARPQSPVAVAHVAGLRGARHVSDPAAAS